MNGHLEKAREICQVMMARADEVGLAVVHFAGFTGLWPLLHLGKADEAVEYAKHFISPASTALCLAYLGRNTEVAEILERLVLKRPGIGTIEDETASYNDAVSLAAAVITENQKAAEMLLKRFTGINVYTTGIYFPTCIALHLGAAAALLGRYDEARQHYQEAIRVCTEMRFRPELALARLQLAELLLERYPDEKKEALEHLDFAIKEFQEMKMQPSLERALRQKKILKA
jgi:tetratricopeptide (TPR) repeat protein